MAGEAVWLNETWAEARCVIRRWEDLEGPGNTVLFASPSCTDRGSTWPVEPPSAWMSLQIRIFQTMLDMSHRTWRSHRTVAWPSLSYLTQNPCPWEFPHRRLWSGDCQRWCWPRPYRMSGAGVGRGPERTLGGMCRPWKVSAEIAAHKDSVPLPPPTPCFPTRVRATLPMSLPPSAEIPLVHIFFFHYCTFYTLWVNTHWSFLLRLILLQSRCISKIFLLSLAHKVTQFWQAGQRRDETAGVFAAS